MLTGGRFDFGIGTGRPEVTEQAAQITGRPPASVAERLTLAEQTIDVLSALDGERHTPVLMAAAGPRARALAAAKADITTLATGPMASRDEVAKLAAQTREAAGARVGQFEVALPIFVVGDDPPPEQTLFLETDVATLVARDSLQVLRGTTRQMAEELAGKGYAGAGEHVRVRTRARTSPRPKRTLTTLMPGCAARANAPTPS